MFSSNKQWVLLILFSLLVTYEIWTGYYFSTRGDITFLDETSKARLVQMEHACSTLPKVTGTGHFRMNANHDVTWCRINKAASTYTVDMLEIIFNTSIEQLATVTKKVTDLPDQERRKIIDNSYMFMFVREPYGRLFSTYSNKFYFPKDHWAPLGPEIVKRCREKPSKDSTKYGNNITFHEMIKFTVEEFEAGNKLDHHLTPMSSICNPCEYRYNFIGKLETMVSDWTYLKQIWSRKKHINVPTNAGERKPAYFHEMGHMKKTFAIIEDSTISRHKLFLRAWSYYKILGHIHKDINMPFKEHVEIEFDAFRNALEEAKEKSKSYAEETKNQKAEALRQAYASIPLQLLDRLRKVVANDCKLFGYDNKPDWVFERRDIRDELAGFDYFQGLE